MDSKVLVTGCSGMLGKYLSDYLGEKCLCMSRRELDISDSAFFESTLKRNKINWVINCAGATYENELDLFKLNAFYPLEMAKVCSRLNTGFVYLSSARVFGEGEGPFDEYQPPRPYDSYGLSKFLGEQFITRELHDGKYYIFRISMTLGTMGQKAENQFLTRLMKKAESGENVGAAVDAETSVVHAGCVAKTIVDCINRKQGNGIYHISSSDYISNYKLTKSVFEQLRIKGNVFPATVNNFSTFTPALPAVQALISTKLPPCGTCEEAISIFCQERLEVDGQLS